MRNRSLIAVCMMMFLATSLLTVAAYDYDQAPVEDAYVDEGSPDDTFNATVLQIQGYDIGFTTSVQRTFLKFDLSSLEEETIQSAVFGIYLNAWSSYFTPSLKLYHIDDDGWSETGITWNNSVSLAAGASAIGDEMVDEARYYEWDVLPDWDSGDVVDGYVSYMLTVAHEDIDSYAYFNSSENAELLPYLRINYIPEPATLAMLAFGGLALLRKRK